MEGRLVPLIVVLALGAGTLGGPDALRALLDLAGRSPVLDIATCLLLISMFATQLLGAVLLARFVRKPPPPPPPRVRAQAGGAHGGGVQRRPRAHAQAGGGAPAADCFAKLTLTVSAGVAFSVAACLAFLSGGGMVSPARLAFGFAGTRTVVLVAAPGFLLCVKPLVRVFVRAAGNGAAPALRATEARTRTFCLVVAPSVARGGLAALRHPSAGSTTAFAGVAAIAVFGAVLLLARISRRAGNGAGSAPSPAASTAARFARLRTAQLTSLASVCFTLAYFVFVAMPGDESGGRRREARSTL